MLCHIFNLIHLILILVSCNRKRLGKVLWRMLIILDKMMLYDLQFQRCGFKRKGVQKAVLLIAKEVLLYRNICS